MAKKNATSEEFNEELKNTVNRLQEMGDELKALSPTERAAAIASVSKEVRREFVAALKELGTAITALQQRQAARNV